MLYTSIGDALRDRAGKNGNLDAAIVEYRNAIAINCFSWAHNNLGFIWEKQDKIQDAIAEYEKAMSCDPNDTAFEKNLRRVRPQQEAGSVTTGLAR
jgi:tetratricopeptide (TPR) repeat protein